MSTTVSVEPVHIEQGLPGVGCACPVYWAMKEAGIPVLNVETEMAYLELNECIDLPETVAERIHRYDCTEVMEPFSFEFDWSPE